MSMARRIAWLFLGLVLACCFWWLNRWPGSTSADAVADASVHDAPASLSAPQAAARGCGSARQIVAAREIATTTGGLTVHVAYDDGSDASDVTVNVRRRGGDLGGVWHARTDAKGWATFADLELEPGRVRVDTDRSERVADETEIVSGQSAHLDITIEVALSITGIVVDQDGVPVPGAVKMPPRAPGHQQITAGDVTGPPGFYMIFLVSSSRVPSEAGWVEVRP